MALVAHDEGILAVEEYLPYDNMGLHDGIGNQPFKHWPSFEREITRLFRMLVDGHGPVIVSTANEIIRRKGIWWNNSTKNAYMAAALIVNDISEGCGLYNICGRIESLCPEKMYSGILDELDDRQKKWNNRRYKIYQVPLIDDAVRERIKKVDELMISLREELLFTMNASLEGINTLHSQNNTVFEGNYCSGRLYWKGYVRNEKLNTGLIYEQLYTDKEKSDKKEDLYKIETSGADIPVSYLLWQFWDKVCNRVVTDFISLTDDFNVLRSCLKSEYSIYSKSL